MIIGGVASSLLGQPRLTADIDATVMIDDKDVDQFLIQASAEGLSPRRTRSAEFMRQSAMLLLQHDASGVPIDLNQGRLPFEQLAAGKAKTKRHGGISIPMPTPEDLIVMKAVAHRPKDLEDIRGIVASQACLDISYIQNTFRALAVLSTCRNCGRISARCLRSGLLEREKGGAHRLGHCRRPQDGCRYR
jgi:hypothetical protein